jgi:hypothetical protein
MRVLHALKQSAMAMDIYTWLTYRIFLLRVKNRGQVLIPWERLQASLGPVTAAGQAQVLHLKGSGAGS